VTWRISLGNVTWRISLGNVTWRISLGNVIADGEDNIKGNLKKSNTSVWAVASDS